ncbi:MAG TPA: NUDIX domain-containing protein [Gemmatimonadales bacterium]|jgi:8-oxo-dGTP diphosphatase
MSPVLFVDLYVFRGRAESLEVLLLRRARGQARPGSWEAVHGRVEDGESVVAAAVRELLEETGCHARVIYNLSRVEQFYLHATAQLATVPVFAAFVADDTVVQLSAEHDTHLWLSPADARERFSWPRAVRALDDALRLIGDGHASVLEDVLRVHPA